jgi:ubiquinone/menaquinone biosynthesis C-methylase UbiE
LFARLYLRLAVPMMAKQGGDDLRRRLLDGLRGTVVEVGAGGGANLPFYPDEVTRVVAVEPEPYLRARTVEAAAAAGMGDRVEVVDGLAQSLPVGDGEADAVVFSLVLCSTDQSAALAEARRVLRPGGEVRVLEHVRALEPGAMRRVQRALDATVWPRLFGGCHTARDTAAAVEGSGLRFTALERLTFPEGSRSPEAAAILGTAVVGNS